MIYLIIILIIICICAFILVAKIDKSNFNEKQNVRKLQDFINKEKIITKEEQRDKKDEPSSKYGKSEELCRQIVEDIFGKKFPRARPNFLKNPNTRRNLEIDCYCEELGIGIEYNGIQHYKYPNIFHKTKEEFIRGLSNDKFKRETCKINGILLIIIPYTLPKCEIRKYIIDQVMIFDKESNVH